MPEPEPTPPSATDEAAERRHAERRRGEQRRVARALWQGAIGLLFGLVAVVIALLAGWRVLTLERSLEADRDAGRLASHDLELLRASLAKLEARTAAGADALGRLEPLPARLETLDGRVARIEARIEAPQRAVARVEAAHLVELAGHRLALEHDVRGAIALFEAADARLADSSDPAALRARAQLAHDLAALRAVTAPDVAALGARLAAAEAAVRELPMLGAINNRFVAPGSEPPPPPGLARAWWQLTTVFQDLLSVRRISDATVRLVSMEEIGVRRHHLETLLFAARLAALRADEADYAANLGAARDWLGRFFDGTDPATRGVDQELAALAASRVSPDLPDVSGSLRLLRGKAS
ncbi:MAG TPA: uroporphyrinogen-III C-methyltransferase [Steroidobacteraceae bacterium]|nr:uroporphyrinogen-III C-methyltransferase [Steroidobacteraceae bacterium]